MSSELKSPEFKQNLASLYAYLAKHLHIKETPSIKLINSKSNSEKPFGFTGHYDPQNRGIVLYITNRHDTDILRSFAHEVIHHWQNERGTLTPVNSSGDSNHYAQTDANLRKREMEAFLFGNLIFRDWQDECRYGPPTTPPQLPRPLDENLSLESGLNELVRSFVKQLVDTGVLSSYHRELSSGDMNPNDFQNDLYHKILSAIQQWIKTVDDRGDWENGEDGMIQ